MNDVCPLCLSSRKDPSEFQNIVRHGSFRRKSDGQWVRRYKCLSCEKTFSSATASKCYGQNKRHINYDLRNLLASGVSERRCARLLHVDRKTVARKLIFLGLQARCRTNQYNRNRPVATVVEFDDLETVEHTKLKPVSVTLAVEHKSRRFLGFQVSQMPANGLLAVKSVKKYGRRKDMRKQGREELFKDLLPIVSPTATFKSDQNPHYPENLKKFFPYATHIAFKGRKPRDFGLGELKKGAHDPLFSLNHSCAMLRANISRLIRKTWCIAKKRSSLEHHIAIYAVYHNEILLKK